MPGRVSPKLDSVHFHLLMKIDGLDFAHRVFEVLFVVQHGGPDGRDPDVIGQQPSINGLGRVSHEYAAYDGEREWKFLLLYCIAPLLYFHK